jgi:glycosyltransferase involved in cell wall biosynthesis
MVKKYKDLDIAVVCNSCDSLQAERIKKYCRLYIHNGQEIECKVAIINYDTTIIKYINEDAKIYETIHGDYSNTDVYKGKKPPKNSRITGYIAITEFLQGKMKDILNEDNVIMSYNPLTVEKRDRPLVLVSATRMHKNKGPARVQKLARALDEAGIDYIWYIITNDINVVKMPNIIYILPRLDSYKWVETADYCVLLSDSEALSYFINEALYRNKPVIVTPLPYLKEIGVENGKNAYILNFDCSNIEDIVKNIKNIPKFKFEPLKDKYGEIFAKSKSKYEEYKKSIRKVRCIKAYSDIELGEDKNPQSPPYWVSAERADFLKQNRVIEII